MKRPGNRSGPWIQKGWCMLAGKGLLSTTCVRRVFAWSGTYLTKYGTDFARRHYTGVPMNNLSEIIQYVKPTALLGLSGIAV